MEFDNQSLLIHLIVYSSEFLKKHIISFVNNVKLIFMCFFRTFTFLFFILIPENFIAQSIVFIFTVYLFFTCDIFREHSNKCGCQNKNMRKEEKCVWKGNVPRSSHYYYWHHIYNGKNCVMWTLFWKMSLPLQWIKLRIKLFSEMPLAWDDSMSWAVIVAINPFWTQEINAFKKASNQTDWLL